jgi:proline iminopeptidase
MAEMADESLNDEDRTARQREMWLGEFFPAISADPEAMRATLARAFAGSELSWSHARYSRESMPTFDLLDRLPEIPVRSLVVAGAHDSIPVDAAERMAKGIPDAEMVLFENSGHFAPLEEPERFRDAVLGFLGVP